MSDILLYEGASPPTPPAGTVILYPKVDGRFYFKGDDGIEYALRPAGGGTGDLLSDGSIPLIANWDVGPFKITAVQFESDVPTGNPPLIIASQTLVANLNSQFLNGLESTAFATAAQGALAGTALQPADVGTAAVEDVGAFATATQGGTADSALQPADVGTAAVQDVEFFAPAEGFAGLNDQIVTTYEFVVADLINCVIPNNPNASAYSIPDALGTEKDTINLYNKGVGPVTIDMAGTDTLISVDNICEQFKAITILKVTANEWAVIGGTS